jgi:hypothetical protein
MHVQIAIRKGFARRNVEVANDLVDLDAALKTAPFLSLCIEVFGIMLALALLDTLTATKRPGNRGVGVTHFIASITATSLEAIGGWRGSVAFTAVRGIEVSGFVFVANPWVNCVQESRQTV